MCETESAMTHFARCARIVNAWRFVYRKILEKNTVYLLLLGRRQLPMRPGGDQHPKEITHTHRIHSKQLDRQFR